MIDILRGWECPRCRRILAPRVEICPCSEGGSGAAAVPWQPASPGSGGTASPAPDATVTTIGTPSTSPAVVYTITPPELASAIRAELQRVFKGSSAAARYATR